MELGQNPTTKQHATIKSQGKLRGKLAEVSLNNLFEMLHMNTKTGVLKLIYADSRYNTNIAMMSGYIGRLKTNFAPKLADIMRSMGAEESQIIRLRDFSQQGQKLTETQDLSLRQLLMESFRERLEMALLPIFEKTDGEFAFHFSEDVDVIVAPGVNPTGLCLDIARRTDELKHYSRLCSRWVLDDEFEVNNAPGIIMRTQTLSPTEIDIVRQLRSPTSLIDLTVKAQVAWDELLMGLVNLTESGAVKHINPKITLVDEFNPMETINLDPSLSLDSNS